MPSSRCGRTARKPRGCPSEWVPSWWVPQPNCRGSIVSLFYAIEFFSVAHLPLVTEPFYTHTLFFLIDPLL